jgi:fatty-acyl-CoA synthase
LTAEGRRNEPDLLRPEPSYVDLMLWALDRFPDRIALVEEGCALTYSEVRDRMSQLAGALQTRGFGRGNGLMVLSGNAADPLLVSLAVRTLGCWQGSLHPMGSAEDHAFILEDSEAMALVFEPALYEDRARALATRLPALKHLLALGPSDVGEDLLAAADHEPVTTMRSFARADDLCSLGYSGGTTGRPKGVMQRHRTVVEMTRLICTNWQLPSDIRFLATTPISHAASCFVLPTWLNGGTIVLQRSFDPPGFYRAVAEHRITLTFMVPTMLYACMDHPATRTADLSSLETIVYGAAPMAPSRLREALEVFGPVFLQLYGQAEAPATVTTLRKEEHDAKRPQLFASCGRPLPGVIVELHDDDDNEVVVGEVGEICVRGLIVADGYWKREELTAETLRNGWLHTGDMATADDEGYLYIVDRKKDMIISGGFNVYPREIEDVLCSHPDVAMAAVIGIPDERWGEAVKALVVARPGAELDPNELTRLVRDRKGPVHAPKSLEIVETLPLTGVGKADRKAIRDRYWHSEGRQVH